MPADFPDVWCVGEHREVTDEKNPADRALELLLFAPLGFALSARELLPQLVERGREQVTGQVTMARMIGQFAVQQGTAEAEKAFERARTQAQAALEQLGVLHDDVSPPPDPPRIARRAAAGPAPASAATAASTSTSTVPPVRPAQSPPAPHTAAPVPVHVPVQGERTPAARTGTADPELAVPDYDSLSASQVLPRLSALTASELEAVRSHEVAHRGRKTILSKVAQLQGA